MKKGQSFTCNCKGTNGNPDALVTWYKDSKEFKKGKKLERKLVLTKVVNEDTGTYRCEAESYENAKDEISIKITVG